MDDALFDELERRIEQLVQLNLTLRQENELLRKKNAESQLDRDNIKMRIDTILTKLQEVELFE